MPSRLGSAQRSTSTARASVSRDNRTTDGSSAERVTNLGGTEGSMAFVKRAAASAPIVRDVAGDEALTFNQIKALSDLRSFDAVRAADDARIELHQRRQRLQERREALTFGLTRPLSEQPLRVQMEVDDERRAIA